MLFNATALSLMLQISPAWGDVAACALSDPDACFREKFGTGIYQIGACYDNVHRLAQVFARSGIDLQKARVMYLTADQGDLKPSQIRKPVPAFAATWPFHVVLVHDGKVYDLSLSNEPRVLPWAQYLRDMFPDHAAIDYRAIPATTYLDEYKPANPLDKTRAQGAKAPRYFVDDPDRRFPRNRFALTGVRYIETPAASR